MVYGLPMGGNEGWEMLPSSPEPWAMGLDLAARVKFISTSSASTDNQQKSGEEKNWWQSSWNGYGDKAWRGKWTLTMHRCGKAVEFLSCLREKA